MGGVKEILANWAGRAGVGEASRQASGGSCVAVVERAKYADHDDVVDHYVEALIEIGVMTQFNALFMFVPLWGPQLALMRLAPLPTINRSRAWVSYRLTDAWVLIAYLAAANSMALSAYEGLRDRWFVQPLTIFANLLVIVLWLKCQRFLHYHAIQRSAARLLFQAFVYPISVLAVSGIVTASLAMFFNAGALADGIDAYLTRPHAIAGATVLVISMLLLFAVRLVFRRFVLAHSHAYGSSSACSN